MNFLVDKLPSFPSDCPFSEKKNNPSVLEKPWYYICKIDKKECYHPYLYCKYLREIKSIL